MAFAKKMLLFFLFIANFMMPVSASENTYVSVRILDNMWSELSVNNDPSYR